MSWDMSRPTRGERREKKKKNNRKMKVDGRSVLTLAEITRRKSKKAREERKKYGDHNERAETSSED